MRVAETILEQLGGNRFRAMTGARSFCASPDGLSFRLPRGAAKNKAYGVIITLDPSDTYTVEFKTSRGSLEKGTFEVATVSRHEGIYCDQLQELFTRETGLYTRL